MHLSRLYHTLRYLKPQQWLYRGWYRLKQRLYHPPAQVTIPVSQATAWGQKKFYGLEPGSCFNYSDNAFNFLNIKHIFKQGIDWDLGNYGKLWAYNLNYFNWLADEDIPTATRLETIQDYLKPGERKNGSEPYPTSLRGINWIKFLAGNNIYNEPILQRLYRDYDRLSAFPEYHIQANHLLENACSLFFAAHFFNDKDFYELSATLLTRQLREQVLPDGGHYELSPMYHSIILQRVLECYELTLLSERFRNEELQAQLRDTAAKMMGWLMWFAHKDGSYALMSDAAPGIALSPQALKAYADHLGITPKPKLWKESPYKIYHGRNYQLVMRAGDIMPSYQPGHAHADSLHFTLFAHDKPVIIDTGISTYDKNERRMYERSTEAHNTVCVNGQNSSDVWDGFRVGKRAQVTILRHEPNKLIAAHDGYAHLGITHQRAFAYTEDSIIITDHLEGYKGQEAYAYIHFHPGCVVAQTGPTSFAADSIKINIDGSAGVGLVNYLYCSGFNKTEPALRLRIHVEEHSVVSIHL